ncbi:DUF3071 domain-containing protein [Nonomuraea glycinis]|uniref:DUF3071 domain-containing protein n=1 Tax=Nonomuraea glycinis TaxID=2047744 RepID=A0A918AAJ2_9ACTN|nr:septation protein SepH [Nonomuraea glycinis]MCA2179422.1 DUF3071 domain-containing protein [Nonomuraea glycinis]GGP09730.1 hypothetical protein GCM10012278_46550 [Nonomuraea glycinis]
MQELRLVAVSEDGTYLVLATAGRGTRFTLPVDDRLRAAVRGNFSRLGQYEIEVESPLRPKEIQARIRAGETAEEIAATAGIPVERVRWFEGPVLQEREYVAQQAQRAAVRMPGESSSGPVLGDLVAERLNRRGVPTDEIDWDSAKRDDGLWRVKLGYVWNGHTRHAEWLFDPRRRHVSPNDDEALRLSSADFDPDPVVEDTTVTPFAPRVAKLQPVPPLAADPLPFPSVIRQQDHEEPAVGYQPQVRGPETYPPSYEVPPPTPAMDAPYDRSPARDNDPAHRDGSRASDTHRTEPPARETGHTRPGETISRRGGSSPWLPDFGQSREPFHTPRPSSPATPGPRPDDRTPSVEAAPVERPSTTDTGTSGAAASTEVSRAVEPETAQPPRTSPAPEPPATDPLPTSPATPGADSTPAPTSAPAHPAETASATTAPAAETTVTETPAVETSAVDTMRVVEAPTQSRSATETPGQHQQATETASQSQGVIDTTPRTQSAVEAPAQAQSLTSGATETGPGAGTPAPAVAQDGPGSTADATSPQPNTDAATSPSQSAASDASSAPEPESDPEPQAEARVSDSTPQAVNAGSADGTDVQATDTSAADARPSQVSAGQEVAQAPSPTVEAATSPTEVTSHTAETKDHAPQEAPAATGTTSEKPTVSASGQATPAAIAETAPATAETAKPAVPEKDPALAARQEDAAPPAADKHVAAAVPAKDASPAPQQRPADPPQRDAASSAPQQEAAPQKETTPAPAKEAASAAPTQDATPAAPREDAAPAKDATPETKAEPAAKAELETKAESEVKAEPETRAEPEVKAEPAAKAKPEGKGAAGSKPVPAARPSKEDEAKEEPAAKEEPPVPVPSPPPAPAARQPRKGSRGRRASVPTWDEIMFGARRQD